MCTKASSSEDDNSDNKNRSSSTTTGGCKPDGSLDPRTMYRNGHGMSPHDLCAQHHEGTGFTEPYTCSSGAGYACCTSNSGDIVEPGKGLGMCSPRDHDTKEEKDDSSRSSSSGECKPDGSLNPRSRMNWGVSATEVCLKQATIDRTELTVPYTCSSGAKFACCSTDTGSTMDEPGHGLGTCTKMPPMPNGLPPEDKEEVDSRFDKEEERHPLGCMCLNSRMTPQRGQCCGKCDEGMCPKSDERCQGCSEENDTCVPNASLGPRSRRFRRFSGLTPSGICKAQSERDGTDFTEPYKCTGRAGDGYACCESGLGDTTTPRDDLGLGKCTKMPSDMEKEEDDNGNTRSSSGGLHHLGCMCLNTRMKPHRGQCCGQCPEGTCPKSDKRCQGCDATESDTEEEGLCEVDPSLSPQSRRHTMRSPSQVCEEESSVTGSGFTTPYKCWGKGLEYACCEADLGDEITSLGGKKCTKEEEGEEEEVLVAYK